MKLRTTGAVWLCLMLGAAAFGAHAETPYAFGPSSPAFAPSDLDKIKASVPGKAPAKAEPAAPTVELPAGPQPYVPSAQPAPIAAPVKAVAAAKPAPKIEAKVAPVKASAQVATPLPAAPAAAPLPTCNYNQIRKTGFDAYVGRMWAARSPEAQKALIGCIDQAWTYHLSAANVDPNSHFEEAASPAMLAAMQYDVDGFIKDIEGRQKLRIMWLATLASDAFNARSAQPCQHEAQRHDLQTLLDDRKAELQSFVAYRDVEDALAGVQCRQSAAAN
jgi:hypothetical protein